MSDAAPTPPDPPPLWYAAARTCCAAPLVFAATVARVSVAAEAYSGRGEWSPAGILSFMLAALMVMFPLTAGIVMLSGLPLAAWLRRAGRLTFLSLSITGALLGVGAAFALFAGLRIRAGRAVS